MRTPRRRLAKLVPALALIALALPASASAQASRTWVSGVGDDANPCSRTAPCKTFPGAISKTAAGGEINCLDPGGFGGVTITKSITIKCHYTEGGVLVSGTNAIVVNAAATDKVVLRGLDINGLGTGLNGVRILQADGTGGHGLFTNGTDAIIVVGDSEITNNTVGVEGIDGGTNGGVYSFKNNYVDSNGTNGTFKGTVTPVRHYRAHRRRG